MPNDKISKMLGVLYNKWFVKWRDKALYMTKTDWKTCIDELHFIANQGKDYPIVSNLAIAFLDEIEARSLGEYKNSLKNL